MFSAITADEVAQIKKPKLDIKDEVDAAADQQLEDLLKKQNVEYFRIRDYLKNNLKKPEHIDILEANAQNIPEGNAEVSRIFS